MYRPSSIGPSFILDGGVGNQFYKPPIWGAATYDAIDTTAQVAGSDKQTVIIQTWRGTPGEELETMAWVAPKSSTLAIGHAMLWGLPMEGPGDDTGASNQGMIYTFQGTMAIGMSTAGNDSLLFGFCAIANSAAYNTTNVDETQANLLETSTLSADKWSMIPSNIDHSTPGTQGTRMVTFGPLQIIVPNESGELNRHPIVAGFGIENGPASADALTIEHLRMHITGHRCRRDLRIFDPMV